MLANGSRRAAELNIPVGCRNTQAEGDHAEYGYRLKLNDPVNDQQHIQDKKEGKGQSEKGGQPGEQGRDVFGYNACQQSNDGKVMTPEDYFIKSRKLASLTQ